MKDVEIVLLIVPGHSEVGEKLQRVACRGEVVDRNFVVEKSKIVVKNFNCLKLTVIFGCLLNY